VTSFTAEEVAKKDAFYNFTRQDPDSTEREGISVFYKDPAGGVFHTYATDARGIDMMNVDDQYLDLVPKGSDEGDRGTLLGAAARRIRPLIGPRRRARGGPDADRLRI
jgi:predicted dithiol-disulfide oxidoreductase (DUF899 family)